MRKGVGWGDFYNEYSLFILKCYTKVPKTVVERVLSNGKLIIFVLGYKGIREGINLWMKYVLLNKSDFLL